jgi:hypothetical protein
MNTKKIQVGDIFAIPLSKNREAFGQYIYFDRKFGPLITIFSLIIDNGKTADIKQILASKPLFPPIITGLFAAIRIKLWEKVGHAQVKNFKYPKFISTLVAPKTKEATTWHLWDGNKWTNIGNKVTKKYKKLEFLVVHSPYDIPNRIETGEKPFKKLIDTNRM